MLEVGNGGQANDEYRAHFSLWCMLAAPLMDGNDLRNMPGDIRDILTNEEVIAIDQDSLGNQAFKFLDYGALEIWVKELSHGDVAFCFLNRSKEPVDVDFDWKKFGIYHRSFASRRMNTKKNYSVRDLWKKENIGTTGEKLVTKLNRHSVLLVRLSEIKK